MESQDEEYDDGTGSSYEGDEEETGWTDSTIGQEASIPIYSDDGMDNVTTPRDPPPPPSTPIPPSKLPLIQLETVQCDSEHLFTGTVAEMATSNMPENSMPRHLLFTPGVNLGPAFPRDFRMTSGYEPVVNVKDEEYLNVTAKFQGPCYPNKPELKWPLSHTIISCPPKRDPCHYEPECAGEDSLSIQFDSEKKMFLLFGQPETIAPTFCPPNFQTTEQVVFDYLEEHNIEELVEYFMTLLCINLPEDPFEYIESHCEQMLACRKSEEEYKNLEVIYSAKHILAMFSTFDKQQLHFITLEQYQNAMLMFGIRRYNPNPLGYLENMISEDVFFEEATKALDLMVTSFIGKT